MAELHDNEAAFHSELKRHLDKIATEAGLSSMTYATTTGSKAGDNYVGVIHRVALSGVRRDATTETKSLIYKCQPDSEERRQFFHTDKFFRNEARFYNELLPAFRDFQTEKHVPDENMFSAVPTNCYHAGDVLILEDMQPHGFGMRDRKEPLDVEHCRLVLRELGRFHALSFALRDQKPEVFRSLANGLEETIFMWPALQDSMEHFDNSCKNAIDNFEAHSKVAEKGMYLKKIKEFASHYYSSMVTAVTSDEAEPYSVLNHGDCWTNNILFKYDKESTSPVGICFLDFQIARHASPVTDISYFLYCCTDQETRSKHYDSLMKDYHNSLSQFLKELGSDPERLFPFSVFQDHLVRFSKFGLGMAVLTIPLFTCDAENLPDIDAVCADESISLGNKMAVENASDNLVCWERMNGVIEDMVAKGYIC